MASGETLGAWGAQAGWPPASGYATPDQRPTTLHPVLAFEDTNDETIYIEDFLLSNYAGGGVSVHLWWAGATATTGTVRWEVAIERQDVVGLDIDADSFATAKSAGGTAPGTSGQWQKTTISFTNGAEIDSLAINERFRLMIRRDANGTTGTDDMAGDAQIGGVQMTET